MDLSAVVPSDVSFEWIRIVEDRQNSFEFLVQGGGVGSREWWGRSRAVALGDAFCAGRRDSPTTVRAALCVSAITKVTSPSEDKVGLKDNA